MIQTGTDERNRRLAFDELEGVVGGADTGKSADDTTSVCCPVCGCKFSLPDGKTSGKCPDCGATVHKKAK